jgi:hypothetical protein
LRAHRKKICPRRAGGTPAGYAGVPARSQFHDEQLINLQHWEPTERRGWKPLQPAGGTPALQTKWQLLSNILTIAVTGKWIAVSGEKIFAKLKFPVALRNKFWFIA